MKMDGTMYMKKPWLMLAGAMMVLSALLVSGCGAGGTATNAAAEAQAAKVAKQDLDSAKRQIDAAQKLQDERLKQAEQQ
jgi:PBP1b-binding outer membrane lipoprotein LpoB